MKTAIIILSFLSVVDIKQTGATTIFIGYPWRRQQEHHIQREVKEHPRLLEQIKPTPTDKCPPHVSCHLECPEGFLKDEQGCEICRCKSASSKSRSCLRSKRVCANECAFGYALSGLGCPTCTCNPGPVSSANGNEGSGGEREDLANDNKDSASENEGSGGVDKDSENAVEDSAGDIEDSTNKKEGCLNRDTCKLDCHAGFVLDPDLLCEVCRCQPDFAKLRAERETSRPEVDCSQRPSCDMDCSYGFQQDADGCEICRCVNHLFWYFVNSNRPYGPIH